jgi:FkbM family methyltransferase
VSAESGWIEVSVAGGGRIRVPAAIDQITPYVLLEQEDWFEDEIRFVRRWLRGGMRAIDVGANFGVYTLAMARSVGNAGRVWAFEPAAETAEALQRSVEGNAYRHVEVIRAAVSDREGSVAFSIGPSSELNAIASAGQAGAVSVPATTLDRAAAEHGWREVDFLKLDVEGHERAAIRGGATFLRDESPLMMLEVKAGARLDMSPLELLAELGYGAYRLLPGPLQLQPLEPLEALDGFLLNVFACKADRARALAASGHLADSCAPYPRAPRAGAWRAFAQSAPYAREHASAWPSKPGWFSRADITLYFEGLEAFACSRAPGRSAAERVAWLQRALSCLADSLQQSESLVKHISYARVAAELGWREAAVASLRQALERLEGEEGREPGEPFLAPNARYEALAPGAHREQWLQCALTEQLEKLRAFSSLYVGTSSLEILEPIRALSFRSPEMDRRWNLVRMRHGMLRAAEPLPLLQAGSEENLNPGLWSGAAWPAA